MYVCMWPYVAARECNVLAEPSIQSFNESI